jgi:hypothetical protein
MPGRNIHAGSNIPKIAFDQRAIVIGASIAGLAAASVLSRYFEEVVVLDNDTPDDTPRARRGVPQGTHVHGLQGHALTLLTEFFPGLDSTLGAAGAPSLDFGANLRSFLKDGWVRSRRLTGLACH